MTDDLLRNARRCMLAFPGDRGPLVTPMAFWSDGASLWMTTSASSFKVERLAGRQDVTAVADRVDGSGTTRTDADDTGGSSEARCAAYIPPLSRSVASREHPASGEGSRAQSAGGLSIEGSARVYTLEDPVGLALHWPVISAALTALAVKNASSLGAYALDLPRTPLRWLPTNRVAIRVRMEHIRRVIPPAIGPGIAPALPGVVPSDIRRALGGERRAVVATGGRVEVSVQPVTVGAGLVLEMGDGPQPAHGTRAVLAMDADARGRPSQVRGLALHGTITPGPALDAERATWWRGFDVSGAQIPKRPAGSIVLPD